MTKFAEHEKSIMEVINIRLKNGVIPNDPKGYSILSYFINHPLISTTNESSLLCGKYANFLFLVGGFVLLPNHLKFILTQIQWINT